MNKIFHHLHKAIECNPEFTDAFVSLAHEYKKVNEESYYVKYLKKAIRIDKKLIGDSAKLQENYAHKNLFGLVRKMFFIEMEQKRHLSNLLIEMGIHHFDKQDLKRANRLFSEAGTVDALNADVYYHQGLIHQKNRNYTKAHECFIQCIEKDIHHTGANIEVGKYYQNKKDYSLAEVHFFCALETNPYDAFIHILICKLYLKLKKPESAKHHYDTAVALDASFIDETLKAKIVKWL
jgi:tetratricopeptide (TPR) repeat protein